MLVHGKLDSSAVNGPGNRAVIWFQGCTLQCAGCWNPGTHDFKAAETPVTDVVSWLETLHGIDGITLSGGEPMQQCMDADLLTALIRARMPHLSIGMFSGYTRRELESGAYTYFSNGRMHEGHADIWRRISGRLDFAVCGRFNQQQYTALQPLCGSRNQSIELFSTRYALEDFQQQMTEVTISENGDLIQITGFPGIDFLNSHI